MGLKLPGGFTVPDGVLVPLAVAIAVTWAVVLVSGILRRRAADRSRAAESRAAAAHERRTTAASAPAAAPAERRRRPVATVAAGVVEIALAHDKKSLAVALAGALDRLLDPAQLMVFVADDEDAREFVLAATAGRDVAAWPLGARLTETTGRVGLVARRRVVMDERDFAAESQFVRDHAQATEPSAFRCELAAPVVVDDAAVAVVSIGGSALAPESTRECVELLTSHASEVAARRFAAAAVVSA
jgi:hypothetical protein